jgi:hypothetical protein
VRECISEQLGEDFDPESPDFGRSLLGRLGSDELAILEACGLDVSGGFGGARRVPGEGRTDGGFGAFGGIGGLGALADPEIQECLTGELGEDFELDFGSRGDDGSGQRGSGFTAGGFGEEFTTALEKCGVNFAGGDFARGARGGSGRQDGGGFAGGALQECLADLLGADALQSLRNPTGQPPEGFQEALEQCGGGIPIPVEPDGGIGDGDGPIPDGPIPEDPVVDEPTATAIPVSDLTVEQLRCLSGELEPAALTSVVIATSSGDLTSLSDEILVALKTCGIES